MMKKNVQYSFSIIAILILFISCTKTSTSPANSGTGGTSGGTGGGITNTTGGITGTVSPASVVCEIDVINVHTGLSVASTTTSSKDGSFSVSNLSPAQYNIRATPTPDPTNLGVHTWIGVVVSAGAVSTIGPISFQ